MSRVLKTINFFRRHWRMNEARKWKQRAKKLSKWNSAIAFWQWRHDDHAKWRKRLSSSDRSLHSLVCFIHSSWWRKLRSWKTCELKIVKSGRDWNFNRSIWHKGLLFQKSASRKGKPPLPVIIGFCSISTGFRFPLSNSKFDFFSS